MKSGLQVAGAIGVGYLLGRTHKMRLALALGTAAATGQLGRAPGALMQRGAKALTSSGGLGQVAEPGQRLLEAGKTAAMAAVTSRIDVMSDRLHERADALRAPSVPGVGQQEAEQPQEAPAQGQKATEAKETREAPAEERGETEEPKREEPKREEPTEAKADEGDAESAGSRAEAAAGSPVRRARG
jgi:hypothetical protein